MLPFIWTQTHTLYGYLKTYASGDTCICTERHKCTDNFTGRWRFIYCKLIITNVVSYGKFAPHGKEEKIQLHIWKVLSTTYFPRSHHSSRSALQVWFGTDITPDALPDVTLPIILAWDRITNQEYTDCDLLRLYFHLLRESHCKPVSHERQMCYSLTMEKPYFTITYFIIIVIFIYINIIEA